MKCLPQLRQVPEQSGQHRPACAPAVLAPHFQAWRCHLHHLSHCLSPKLFSYFTALTISPCLQRLAFSAASNRRSHMHGLHMDPVKASASLQSHTLNRVKPTDFSIYIFSFICILSLSPRVTYAKTPVSPGFHQGSLFWQSFLYLSSFPAENSNWDVIRCFIQFQQDSSGLGITINRMFQNKSKHKITLSLARKRFDYLHFRMKKLQKNLHWSLKAWLVPNWNVASKQVCPSNLILTGISLSWFVPSLVTGRECRVLGIADGAIPVCTNQGGFYV